MSENVLHIDHLTMRFGGVVAVNDLSMDINKGEIVALIGPNGAGKTTFFNCISGVYTPSEGKVIFEGQEIQGKRPYQINKLGITRTYQNINLFRKMTVQENVLVGMHSRLQSNYLTDMFHIPSQQREEKEAYAKAYEWLKFVGLEPYAKDQTGSLSYGKQRLLEIVRGLASDPKLILLDEPAAGMTPHQ